MKKLMLLSIVGALTLASCGKTDTTGNSVSKSFTNMSVAGYTAPGGTAKYVDLNTGDRITTLTVTGLKANTSYVAHYHALGTADADPCKSNGAVVGGVIGAAATSNADGALTIKGLQATADLKTATYINVHEAASLATVPVCAKL